MLDGRLDRAFAIGIAYPGGVGDDAVMLEHLGIDAVEFRLEEVGLDHAFLEVVENDVLHAAAEVTKGFLVQAGPGFRTGIPDDLAE